MSDATSPTLDDLGAWPGRLRAALVPEGIELSGEQIRDVVARLFQFQPIETAPRDRTEVELWSEEWGGVTEMASFEKPGKWVSDSGWTLNLPTHWRHRLPVPATITEDDGDE